MNIKEKYRKALSGWRELNEVILTLTKEDIDTMIEIEQNSGKPRETLIRRMKERRRALMLEEEK